MAKQLISKIQLRRDTAANWSTNNPTLSKGEIALSYDVDAQGVALPSSYRVKVGDGTTAWNSLIYFAQGVLTGSGAPAASIGEDGQFYVDTTNKYLYYKNGTAWIAIGGDKKKLDKNETASYSVYGVAGAGDQVMFPITGGHNQIVGVGGDGKIPVGLLPDVVLGNVLYGGNLNAAPTSNDVWAAAPSASLKTRLRLTDTVASITLKNQESGASTTGYGWKALEGVYFIANAAGTFAGISFEVGDWLISTGSAWEKIDNTDTIKGATGNITIENGIIDTVSDPTFNSVLVGTTSAGTTIKNTGVAITGTGGLYTQLTNYSLNWKGSSITPNSTDSSLTLRATGGVKVGGGRLVATNGADVSGTLTVTGVATFSTGVTIGDNLTIDNGKGIKFIGTDSLGAEHYYGTIVPNTSASNNPRFTLPKTGGTLALVEDITGAITGKQDKLTAGRNIEIVTGNTIQTKLELDATKIYSSDGDLTVGDGVGGVTVGASGIYLNAGYEVSLSAANGVTVGGGMSITGDVAMADNLSVSGSITTKSNNPTSQTLKEVVVDTDYVIIDGGNSTTTW